MHIYRILGSEYQLPLDGDIMKTKEMILMRSTVLFAQKGFCSVPVKDIATEIGIKPASLYNHFESKEKLWEAVLEQTRRLYLLYFSQLDLELEKECKSFESALEIMFLEPVKMENAFTCFAFSLVMSSQFGDEGCWNIYKETFIEYSLSFFEKWFNRCIDRGYVEPFDTRTVSIGILYHSLMGVNIAVQKLMGREFPYDHSEAMTAYKDFVLMALKGKIRK
jgi:AcrR family transcriptional regulator